MMLCDIICYHVIPWRNSYILSRRVGMNERMDEWLWANKLHSYTTTILACMSGSCWGNCGIDWQVLADQASGNRSTCNNGFIVKVLSRKCAAPRSGTDEAPIETLLLPNLLYKQAELVCSLILDFCMWLVSWCLAEVSCVNLWSRICTETLSNDVGQ